MACPRCSGTTVEYDDLLLAEVCTGCGLVVDEAPLRAEERWDDAGCVGVRLGEDDDGSRAAAAGLRGRDGSGGAARGMFRDRSGVPHADACRKRVTALGDALRLPLSAVNEVAQLALRAADGRWGAGRWAELILGAATLLVVRQDSLAIALPEIAAAVGHETHSVGRAAHRIAAHLGIPVPALDVSVLLRRAAASPTLAALSAASVSGASAAQAPTGYGGGRDSPLVLSALRLMAFSAARGITTGREPRALAAACLALAAEAQALGEQHTAAPPPLQAVASAMVAAKATTSQRFSELRRELHEYSLERLPWAANASLKALPQHLPFLMALLRGTLPEADAEEWSLGGEAEAVALVGLPLPSTGRPDPPFLGVAGEPPAFRRSNAERARITELVAAATRRIDGTDPPVPPPPPEPMEPPPPPSAPAPVLALEAPPPPAEAAAEAADDVCGADPATLQLAIVPAATAPPPRKTKPKRSRPLGGALPPVQRRRKAGAVVVAPVAPPPPPPGLTADEEEVEHMLRQGVPAALIIEHGIASCRPAALPPPPAAATAAALRGGAPCEADLPDDEMVRYLRTPAEAELTAALRGYLERP